MRFVTISPKNFGPFVDGVTLNVDPKVTVLTGANDVGKSCLLRLIHTICNSEHSADESLINRARYLGSGVPWNSDKEVGATIKMEITAATPRGMLTSQFRPNSTVEAYFPLNPDSSKTNGSIRSHKAASIVEPDKSTTSSEFNKLPKSLLISSEDSFGNVIEMNSPSPVERYFLTSSFGSAFKYEQIEAMSDYHREIALQAAEERFSTLCKKMLPESLQYRFRLRRLPDSPTKLAVQTVDRVNAMVPVASRGAGAKKMLGMLIAILSFAVNAPCVVLIDEPENSLHADAQRALRDFLEQLAENDGVQVIYATHSPVMINSLRADSIRLVSRTQLTDGSPASVIENKPISGNLLKVRSSLGLCPSDSLLYSDVAVVVEGAGEILAIPEIMAKLEKHNPDFKDVGRWLSNIHFIDGSGDNFERLCNIAKSQGSKPILFVDGDKKRRLRQIKFSEKHSDIPVVELPDQVELEDMVPRTTYFAAVAEVHELQAETCNAQHFDNWLLKHRDAHIAKQLFSKQVNHWLIEEHGFCLEKPRVILAAARRTEPEDFLHLDCLLRLQSEILAMFKLN